MPNEWRECLLVPIFKNGVLRSIADATNAYLFSHIMEYSRKVLQMAISALAVLVKKFWQERLELCFCVFKKPREELGYWMRMSGVAEKYMSLVEDMLKAN